MKPIGLFSNLLPQVTCVTVSGVCNFENLQILSAQNNITLNVYSTGIQPARSAPFNTSNYPQVLSVVYPEKATVNKTINIDASIFGSDLSLYRGLLNIVLKTQDTILASVNTTNGQTIFQYEAKKAGEIGLDLIVNSLSSDPILKSFKIFFEGITELGEYLRVGILLILIQV